jgi:hypothetical protein
MQIGRRLGWSVGLLARAAIIVVVAAVLGTGLWIRYGANDNNLTAGTNVTPLSVSTYPASSGNGCFLAGAIPVQMEHSGDQVVFISTMGGQPVAIEWPAGFHGQLVDGKAVLVDPSGRVVAREGDVLDNLGGAESADGAFRVCSIGSTDY